MKGHFVKMLVLWTFPLIMAESAQSPQSSDRNSLCMPLYRCMLDCVDAVYGVNLCVLRLIQSSRATLFIGIFVVAGPFYAWWS